MIRHHPVNQESLLHCHGPSIIGAILSKVSATHVTPLQKVKSNVCKLHAAESEYSISSAALSVQLGGISYVKNSMEFSYVCKSRVLEKREVLHF